MTVVEQGYQEWGVGWADTGGLPSRPQFASFVTRILRRSIYFSLTHFTCCLN